MRYYAYRNSNKLIHIDNKPFEDMEYPGFIIHLNKQNYNSVVICTEPDSHGFSKYRSLNYYSTIEDCITLMRVSDFFKSKYYILSRLRKKKLEKI